jgi:hypothetical protein
MVTKRKRQVLKKSCEQCRKHFLLRADCRKQKFCSRKCFSLSIIGHKAWNKGLEGWHSKAHINATKQFCKKWHRENKVWSTGKKWWRNPKTGKAWTFKGVITATNGYISIYKPEHPRANSRGYVYEHRYIMEQHLGRFLERKEVVHHINHNRHDNRLKNLELMSKEKHNHLHHFGLPKPKRRKIISDKN